MAEFTTLQAVLSDAVATMHWAIVLSPCSEPLCCHHAVSHNLNWCSVIAYGDAVMWLKCVQCSKNAIFTAKPCSECDPCWSNGSVYSSVKWPAASLWTLIYCGVRRALREEKGGGGGGGGGGGVALVHLDSGDWKDLRVGAEAMSLIRIFWLTVAHREQENFL